LKSFNPAKLLAFSLWCLAICMAQIGTGAEATISDETVLRRVADAVLQQTTRRLLDTETGQTYEDSRELPAKASIRIESKFNGWFYQNWLLTDGMRRVAQVLDEPKYRQYGERNLDFLFAHMGYFEKQHAAGIAMQSVGDGRWSPIGFYFEIGSLWQTGLAPLVAERHAATGQKIYEPYLKRMNDFLATNPRYPDGSLYRPERGLMTDDAYMTVPFLVRQWKASGNTPLLDDAVQQVLRTHSRLFDREHGLFKHLWDLNSQKPVGQFWGRGNGWMVLAEVELLGAIPRDHPRRAEVLAAYQNFMEGLRRAQDEGGGWHQVLDHPESWIETSCTGMFTYGLARGVNEGWLNTHFVATANNGWRALQKKVAPDGDLIDVCGSSGSGDLNFYLNRPRLKGDLHGFGSFLLAGAEILRLNRQIRPTEQAAK
jgi:unsaturated rhamnogalacturonyl hydrolase